MRKPYQVENSRESAEDGAANQHQSGTQPNLEEGGSGEELQAAAWAEARLRFHPGVKRTG
jgi:hypothetical protein